MIGIRKLLSQTALFTCNQYGKFKSGNGYACKSVNEKDRKLVGTGRFELPTPRTPSECSTRLSHVPTKKGPPGDSEGFGVACSLSPLHTCDHEHGRRD